MRAEPNPETGEFGEGLVEETAGGDAESDVDKDIEQMNSIKILVNSITLFGLLSSSNCMKEAVIRRYHKSINEVLMLLKPALEETIILQIVLDEKLNDLLFDLDALVDEAGELLGSWDNMMSKVYFLRKIEPVITMMKISAISICQLISSQSSIASAENLESIIKKIQLIHYDGTLDNVKGALEDQMNKRLPKSDNLEKISNALSLSSNQELLMEIVALDKLKSKGVRSDNHAELEFIDHAMAMITYMHDCYLKVNQLHSINGVPIPPDFCCPLSLQLMFDPVIVASGQTYERTFIKSWIDQGFNVCAKTRQTLAHSNLIPNYTVKGLIATWCESNNIKLPDPVKSRNQSLPIAFSSPSDAKAIDGNWSPSGSHQPNNKHTRTSEEGLLNKNFHKDLSASNGVQENYQNEKSLSPRHRPSSPFRNANEFDTGIERKPLSVLEDRNRPRPEPRHVNDGGQTSISSKQELPPDDQLKGGGDSGSASAAVLNDHHEEVGDARTLSRVPSDLTHYSSDASGKLCRKFQLPLPLS
ncbi:hypothetical protein HPP92_015131 [Vanilla planifolia]|uniref:U-box domain-containing protein n=1 Tax=Vanilla planifolia TaxID=51239 RepID=A0A835URR6_VANPL|nr:hypothetical protein HPP92_015131 [Vanilla planifolia]